MSDMVDLRGRRLKVYFVELDDYDRERVISGIVENVQIEVENDYGDVYNTGQSQPILTYATNTTATVKARMVPDEHGSLFHMENFLQMELEEEDDE